MDIDSFVESLWLRALDLTSKDFKSERAYSTGKANYEKLAKQALQSYIDTKIIEARKGELYEIHEYFKAVKFDKDTAVKLSYYLKKRMAELKALNHRKDEDD